MASVKLVRRCMYRAGKKLSIFKETEFPGNRCLSTLSSNQSEIWQKICKGDCMLKFKKGKAIIKDKASDSK